MKKTQIKPGPENGRGAIGLSLGKRTNPIGKEHATAEIAKELGMSSAVALNCLLCERRVQFKQNGTYVLYAEYAEHGYVHIKQMILEYDKIVYRRRWTQLGREWLLDMLG